MKNTLTLTVSGIYACLVIIYFLPVDIPFKTAFPLALLASASIFLTPWQMCLAFLFSAIGDLAGARGNFMIQMGSFAIAHIWFIAYFIKRYMTKVEHDRKLTAKAKGLLAMLTLCTCGILTMTITSIIPHVPQGLLRIGTGIYAIVISMMMMLALLQRSTVFAIGAVLFVFSDFILAWNMFVEPIHCSGLLIMIPYFLGQWLLFIRATPYRIPGLRPFRP